jgi:hypothetical protein
LSMPDAFQSQRSAPERDRWEMPGYKNYYQFSERLLEQLSHNAKTLCQIAPIGTGLIMPLSIKALVPLGRATMLASVVIVASGILEITGCPLFAAVGKVTLNWAAVRSETEKLRQKITTAAYQARIRSAACQSTSDRHASSVFKLQDYTIFVLPTTFPPTQ